MIAEKNKKSFDENTIRMFMSLFLEIEHHNFCGYRESFLENSIKRIGFNESIIEQISSLNLSIENPNPESLLELFSNKSSAIASYIEALSVMNENSHLNKELLKFDFSNISNCAKDFMIFDEKSKSHMLALSKGGDNPHHCSWTISNIVKQCLKIIKHVDLNHEDFCSLFNLSKKYDTSDNHIFNFILDNSKSKYLFKEMYFSIKRKKGYVDKKCKILSSISRRGIVVDEIIDHITDSSHERIRKSVGENLIYYYSHNCNSDKDLSKVLSAIRKFGSLENYEFLRLVIRHLPKDELKWYVTSISKFSWLQREFNKRINE